MTPAAHNLAELELADRARCGDRDALVALYGRYKEVLYRHARRMLRCDASAKDMVQEAFARAIVSLPQTRAAAELRFRAWMLRIVTNLCLRELNRGQRGAVGGRDRDPDQLASERRELDPQQARQRTELGVLVERALSALPDRYRQILLLREVEELSYEELSEALELSDGSVKVTLHRARARFAAVFLAERALEDRDTPRDCPELQSLLLEDVPERRVVRHIESCERCRAHEQRSAAELIALLPPLPAAAGALPAEPTTPASSVASAQAAAASAAATSGAGGLSAGLVAAIAAATVGIVGVAIAAAMALRPANERPVTAPPPGVQRSALTGPPTFAARSTPLAPALRSRGRASVSSSAGRASATSQPSRRDAKRGHARWTSPKSPPRAAGPVPQMPDPEEAPPRLPPRSARGGAAR